MEFFYCCLMQRLFVKNAIPYYFLVFFQFFYQILNSSNKANLLSLIYPPIYHFFVIVKMIDWLTARSHCLFSFHFSHFFFCNCFGFSYEIPFSNLYDLSVSSPSSSTSLHVPSSSFSCCYLMMTSFRFLQVCFCLSVKLPPFPINLNDKVDEFESIEKVEIFETEFLSMSLFILNFLKW